MIRGLLWCGAVLVFVWIPNAALAQNAVKSPFDFAFGPQEDGTFGAILKGSTFKSLRRSAPTQQTGQLLSLFAGVEVDGSWNSAASARNNASIALRPSLALQKLSPRRLPDGTPAPATSGPWLHIYLDVRQRFGDFAGDSVQARRINQLILGGAVQLRWVGFAKWYSATADIGREDNPPTLTVGYHTVQKNVPAEETLPADMTASALQVKLHSRITLPICTQEEREVEPDPNDPFETSEIVYTCPWGLLAEGIATRLSNNGAVHFRIDVALFYDTGGSFSPVVRYRSGEEHGLQYDKQFLIGLLWQLPIGR
jgi:hypothetical protein